MTRARKKIVILVASGFLVGTLFVLAFASAVDYTNTTEFCVSCHSVSIAYEEYQQSWHYENASGVRASCADCHVPTAIGPKLLAKVMAAKDVYHELAGTIDTPEKYEQRRWLMANRVWQKMEATDSRACRGCHVDHAMNLKEQESTAKKKHRRARESGETCISCHKGVAHHEPLEPAKI
jgi:cytochrome c-type protein NapC